MIEYAANYSQLMLYGGVLGSKLFMVEAVSTVEVMGNYNLQAIQYQCKRHVTICLNLFAHAFMHAQTDA